MSTGIKRGGRRAVSLSGSDLTTTSNLPGREGVFPLVVSPAGPKVDLPAWAAANRDELTQHLQTFGAVLFRGFGVDSADSFAAAAEAAAERLYADYGDLPRDEAGSNIFSSTPYPPDLPIHFHNESSHMAKWPMRIFFNCVTAAESGGETPLVDCRQLYRELDQDLMASMERRGLTYVRNFGEGIDVPWQSFFGTDDRAEVEAKCADADTVCEWLGGDKLRIRQGAQAVRTHPVTQEKVFFNQILLHHPAAIPVSTRSALLELFDPEFLPRNVTYGDGEPIADEVIDYLLAELDARSARYPWHAGDMIMLDNMLVCHGRAPFTGARKVVVAMSGIVAA